MHATAANVVVRLKAEKAGDPNVAVETEATTTRVGWQTLVFNFSNHVSGTPALDTMQSYNLLSLFYGFGTAGNNEIYYTDSVYFRSNPVSTGLHSLDAQQSLRVYPNPSQGQVNLAYAPVLTGTHHVQLMDMTGRKVWEAAHYLDANEETLLQLNFGSLTPGTYLIRIFPAVRPEASERLRLLIGN